MRKTNPVRYSSAVGEAWLHGMFKIKYCHKIFDDEIYREGLRTLLLEAAYLNEIELGEIGFDDNHLHCMIDIGNYSRPEVAKMLKGFTAKKFFEHFPELKMPKEEGGLFWGSGLWNPSYYLGAPKNLENTIKYISKQKYGLFYQSKSQKTLEAFVG